MPDWTPPPDVAFDHVRARLVIEEAERVHATLVSLLAAEQAGLERARHHWIGRVRAETDEAAELHQWSIELAMQRLRELLTAVDDAMDDALREQARRRILRDRWVAEDRAERAAAELRAAAPSIPTGVG